MMKNSLLSTILLSPVNKLSEIMFKSTKQSKIVLNKCLWVLMCEDNRGWTFSLDETLLLIMD